jgi:DNA-binding MarR family transcriptional regulator
LSTLTRKQLEAGSWLAVVRAYHACNRRYARLLEAFGLTVTQFDVLAAVRTLGPDAMPRAIADELVVTRGNITGVLHRLQERGLVSTRAHVRDGRSFVCQLTPDGEALLGKARAAAAAFIEEQLAPFGDAELEHTWQQMERMREHLASVDPQAIIRRTRSPQTGSHRSPSPT